MTRIKSLEKLMIYSCIFSTLVSSKQLGFCQILFSFNGLFCPQDSVVVICYYMDDLQRKNSGFQ